MTILDAIRCNTQKFSRRILGTVRGNPIGLSYNAKNRHIAVLGGSGSGKTSEITMLAVQAALDGELVIEINMRNCLNPDCLMESVRKAYQAVTTRIDVLQDGLHLPLFDKRIKKNGVEESDVQVVHRITSLLAQAGGLTPTQTTYLKDAITAVHDSGRFSEGGIRLIQDFLEVQEERTAKNVAGKLRALLDDNLILDGDDLKDASGILEFDVNGLQYDDQITFVNFILDYVLRLAETGAFIERGITLVVDECQNFSYSQGSTMYTLLNESRRLGVSLILAATELPTNKASSVVEQCGTVLYFAPTATSRKKIAKKIAPQDVQKWVFQLSKLEVGQFIAVGKFQDENGRIVDRPMVMNSFIVEDDVM